MSEPDVPDILHHCSTCTSNCCSKRYLIATEEEHDRITAQNHPDHFAEILLPEGRFYLLSYTSSSCRYLAKGECSIDAVKPNACRAFPAQPVYDQELQFIQFDFDGSCPAAKFLSEEFLQAAGEVARKHHEDIPPDLHFKLRNAFENAFDAGALTAMNTVVTLPSARTPLHA